MSAGDATPTSAPPSGPFTGAPTTSLSERRRSDAASTNPPSLSVLTQSAAPTTLKQTLSPREACAPSLNATATGLTPEATPTVIANTAANARLGRSGTVKKSSKRTPSKQPVRRGTDAGYEGEVERHGQPNDFVDPEDSDDGAAPPPAAASKGSSAGRKQRYPDTLATDILSSVGANFPDAESVQRSTFRNRNPSMSSHQHPGRLPLHSRNSSRGSAANGGAAGHRPRASSISSTRSHEAGNHPFPTPGHKHQNPVDDWQSIEEKRLEEDERKEKHWKRWGPYVSERQWVRRPRFYSVHVVD